jgi:DNA modification methylase
MKLDLTTDIDTLDVRSLIPHIDFANEQKAIPQIAKDPRAIATIANTVATLSTTHQFTLRDARDMSFVPDASVHLIVTSPPYWTLKEYRDSAGQLGHIADYEQFLVQLEQVWEECLRVLVAGGRLIIVVGDVCLSRRKHGRHRVVPLHASIQEDCRRLGFDNLAPIFWHKISNANYEVDNGSAGFLGKPFEPNGVIKNDVEFILSQRKPGGYRKPTLTARVLSVISDQEYQKWFRQIWTDLPGASTKDHPAPYPEELTNRLIRMFSFAGDTVLDPFLGTGTTSLSAAKLGRNSIGVEIEREYLSFAAERMSKHGFLVDVDWRDDLDERHTETL